MNVVIIFMKKKYINILIFIYLLSQILVDVPCTNDRHSLENNENNMFKPTRAKERLKLPEIQADILK